MRKKTVGFLLKRVDCHDGVASHCETLIRGLKAAGWRVVLITGPIYCNGDSEQRVEIFKSLVDEWVVFEDLRPMLPSVACIRRIQELVKQHGISVFHAHGYSMLVVARVLKIVTGLQCVASFHPSLHSDDPKQMAQAVLRPKIRQYQLFLRLFAPKAFIALSSEIEEFLIQDLRFPGAQVRKILPGIDTKYFRPPTSEERQSVREKFGLQPRDLVCALVGRFNWNKGHDVLIEAARHVTQELPAMTLRCLFSGSGHQEKQIKDYALVSEADSRCFLFLGYVEDLREVYWASDIFTLPSRSEGFGLVVAEAMGCGATPIRTPGGGARDQIQQGKTGYVVPFDDAKALSEAIQNLADAEFRLQMGRQCVQYTAMNFDRDLMVQKTVELYDECSGMDESKELGVANPTSR